MAKRASLEPGVRFIHLDAVRGVAALTVVLSHYWQALPAGEVPAFFKTLVTGPGIRILFTGTPAVMVFFVLSGYVLSLPYHRGRPPSYRQFAVRRVFRIYVPYIVAIAIAAAADIDIGLGKYPARGGPARHPLCL